MFWSTITKHPFPAAKPRSRVRWVGRVLEHRYLDSAVQCRNANASLSYCLCKGYRSAECGRHAGPRGYHCGIRNIHGCGRYFVETNAAVSATRKCYASTICPDCTCLQHPGVYDNNCYTCHVQVLLQSPCGFTYGVQIRIIRSVMLSMFFTMQLYSFKSDMRTLGCLRSFSGQPTVTVSCFCISSHNQQFT